ncbi:hypothetical protein PENSPDRAFT_758639 [Peniophora sp. CONT]|nr:hypothetical protein PENSPDRAFT_758639 [Peniophora sp. CONT]
MRCSITIFSILALALGAVAIPEPEAASQFELVKRSCGGGTVSCCNSIQSSSSSNNFNRNTIFFLLTLGFTQDQIVALEQGNTNGSVAQVCSGSGSVSCNQQNVCCNGSHFSGLNVQACNAINV